MSPGDQCNYCRAPIRWMTTQNGKAMPVDAEPDPTRGNVIRLGGQVGVLGPRAAIAARAAGRELFLPHAASCPDVARWSSKPSGKPRRRGPARR